MKNVYFIGIGGIGMSALARYYKFKGYNVAGYDRTPSDLTAQLEQEGISVHYEDRPDLVPADVAETLVVYTPAIPKDLGELQKVFSGGYNVLKRSRTLGEITRGQRCLAVAGTHGKTTTSTLTAHIFTQTGEGCSAFLGGISRNYGTNLLMSKNETVVVEADEFDRSFLQLFPEIAVITAVDPDHLDIYGDYAHVVEAFKAFASQVTGTVIAKKGTPIGPADTKAKVLTYHYTDTRADFCALQPHPDEYGCFHYHLQYPGGVLRDIRVGAPGWVNAENSVAAAAIASMRDIFPGRKLTAIFQPHLYTRTRDFAQEFAQALSMVDKLILLDIYPAREEPIPGVTSDMIFKDVTAPEKVLLKKEELMDYLSDEPLDVLVTFGAGNIDRFIEPITELLKSRL